ncbi:unnamed protein product [Umbelopsis ramanniana]
MDPVSKFCFANRILPQSARFSQYPQSPIKTGYIDVTEEGLMEVLMADRQIEAFLRELFELENWGSLHAELQMNKQGRNGLFDMSLATTTVRIEHEKWILCDDGTIGELKKTPTGWHNGHKRDGPEAQCYRYHPHPLVQVNYFGKNPSSPKQYQVYQVKQVTYFGKVSVIIPSDDGIGKYLDDVEKAILDEDKVTTIPHTIRSSYRYKRKAFLGMMARFRQSGDPQIFMTFSHFTRRKPEPLVLVSAFGLPAIHMCVAHNLSQCHRDALECALIAWFTLYLGMGVLNKSPYGNHFYREVNPNANVNEISPSDYHARLTIVVGSAPPASVASTASYQSRSDRHTRMNWDAFRNSGLGMLRHNLDQVPLPPFINHYPDEISQDIDDWYPRVDQETVNTADSNLKQSMREYSKPIALMLGTRPTRLVAGSIRNNFVKDRCGQLNFSRLRSDRFIAMLWMPDPSYFRHFRLKDRMCGVELYTLTSKVIYALEGKVLSLRDRRTDEPVDFGFTNLEVEILQFFCPLDDWDGESRRSM